MSIIAFSGKKQSGKNLAGDIVQVLLSFPLADNSVVKKYLMDPMDNPDWKIKSFASYLKSIVASLTNCSIADLEIEEKKNEVVYTKYRFTNKYLDLIMEFETTEEGLDIYNKSFKTYIDSNYDSRDAISENITYEEIGITRRDILQRIGTDIARNIHSNIWIDKLFSEYKEKKHYDTVTHKFDDAILISKEGDTPRYKIPSKDIIPYLYHGKIIDCKEYEFTENVIQVRMPKWIITDTRFVNEAEAITKRGGLLIRINRPLYWYNESRITFKELQEIYFKDTGESITLDYAEKHFKVQDNHIFETALDNYQGFHYIIENIGSVDDLIDKLRSILITNKLI